MNDFFYDSWISILKFIIPGIFLGAVYDIFRLLRISGNDKTNSAFKAIGESGTFVSFYNFIITQALLFVNRFQVRLYLPSVDNSKKTLHSVLPQAKWWMMCSSSPVKLPVSVRPLFLWGQACRQRKSLAKRKRRKEISRSAERDQRRRLWKLQAFKKA